MTYSWNIYYSFVLPVNKSLLTIFLASKFAEQSGHGIPTIVENYGRDVFSFEDGMLKVTIPLAFERTEVKESILLFGCFDDT